METLDADLREFVRIWNNHYIRKQSNRPHVIPGIPWTLFTHPELKGSEDYRQDLIPAVVDEMEALLGHQEFDLTAYLPPEVSAICQRLMEEMPPRRYEHEHINGVEITHYGAYVYLRERLREYDDAGILPRLKLTEAPTGGIRHLEDLLREQGFNVEGDDHLEPEAYESDWDLDSDIDWA